MANANRQDAQALARHLPALIDIASNDATRRVSKNFVRALTPNPDQR